MALMFMPVALSTIVFSVRITVVLQLLLLPTKSVTASVYSGNP